MSSGYERRTVLAGVAAALLGGCAAESSRHPTPGPPAVTTPLTIDTPGHPGVNVHLLAGGKMTRAAGVLFVFHGAERRPLDYLASWEPLVAGQDVLVIAPEFDATLFPGVEGYNLGSMRDADGHDAPLTHRAYQVVSVAFTTIRAQYRLTASTFDLFGHSAGAQFLHRFLTFTPSAPVGRAVSANAGWYTMPDHDVTYPYGIREAPKPRAQLSELLGRDLVVLLGEADTEDELLRQDKGAMAQGATRVARGHAYVAAGREAARRAGAPFRWRIVTVPGIGHEQEAMAKAAAPLLYPTSTTTSTRSSGSARSERAARGMNDAV